MLPTLPPPSPVPSQPHPLTPPRPSGVLAVRLGGNTGAVSNQQSHRGSAGHSDGHAGCAHSVGTGRVRTGLGLVGVGAHVTLELCGRFALHTTQLAEQHSRPTKDPLRAAALLPLLAMMLLSVHAQIGERGEAWDKNTMSVKQYLFLIRFWFLVFMQMTCFCTLWILCPFFVSCLYNR